MKRNWKVIVFAVVAALLLAGCSSAQGVAQDVVELPVELQALIGSGIAYLIGLVLRGRVPLGYEQEIASAITGAVLTVIGVVLKLIPQEFAPVATAVLTLIVVLLGTLQGARLLFIAFGKKDAAQRAHLIP